MNSFLKNALTVGLLGVCVWGGVQHWRDKEAAASQLPAAAETVPGSAPEPAPAATPAAVVPSRLEPNATMSRVFELLDAKSPDAALELASALVRQLEPLRRTQSDDLGVAWLVRGEVYEALQRNDEAIADFEHTYYLWRDDTPDSGRGWLRTYASLSRVYARAGRWSETLVMADRGLKAAALTPAGNPVFEIKFHEKKLAALLALNQRAAAELEADLFRRRSCELFPRVDSSRAHCLGLVAEAYKKLGLSEKSAAARSEAAQNIPQLEVAPQTLRNFQEVVVLAKALMRAGKREEAAQRLAALKLVVFTLPQPEECCEAALQLCQLYHDLDRYEEGLAFARQLVDFSEKTPEVSVALQLKALRKLENFHASLCHWEDALSVEQRILELDRKAFGEASPVYIRDLISKANVLFFADDPAKALVCARDALAKAERLPDAEDSLIEHCLSSVGFIISQSSVASPTEAEVVLRRAVDLHERRNGKLAPGAADNLINLATALIYQNRLDDAGACLDKAFFCIKANKGRDADIEGWAQCQLALLYLYKKDWPKALVAARRGVEIREQLYGLNNHRTRVMLRRFVSVAWQAGAKQECVKRAEQLLASERADHSWTVFRDLVLCARLASWHLELGNRQRAEELNALFGKACSKYYNGVSGE